MATQNPPYVIQASSHGAALFRQAHAALLGLTQPGSLALGVGGIVNLSDLAVTQNGTPNMSANVAGGSCFMPQTIAANGGVYFGLNDATLNLVISASSPSNPRIDTIVAEVADAAYSGGSNAWSLAVITGTPTAGATLSNLSGAALQPSSSILVAYILVPTSATTIVTADIGDARPISKIGGDTGWVAVQGGVGFSGSWANAAGWNPAGYRRIGNRVFIRGTVSGGANNSTVFTLPSGYRPPNNTNFACAIAASTGGLGYVEVGTGGQVVWNNITVGSGTSPSLDGISYTTD